MKRLPTTNVLDWQWVNAELDQVINYLLQQVKKENTLLKVATPNPEQVILAQKQPSFAQCLAQFDYLLPDGEGIVWASHLLAKKYNQPKLKQRLTGIDTVSHLLDHWSDFTPILLIGGRKYANHHIKIKQDKLLIQEITSLQQIKSKNQSGHNLIHWLVGYDNIQAVKPNEEHLLKTVIKQLKPKLVLVALGAPQQEQWIIDHQELLIKSSARLVITVGGAFDMLIGYLPRAPLPIRQVKLEWLWRLTLEPSRWRRQLTLLKFIFLVFKSKFIASTSA